MCLNPATLLSINLGSHPHLTPFVLLKSLQGLVNGLKCTAVLSVESRTPFLLANLHYPRVYKRLAVLKCIHSLLCLPGTDPIPTSFLMRGYLGLTETSVPSLNLGSVSFLLDL